MIHAGVNTHFGGRTGRRRSANYRTNSRRVYSRPTKLWGKPCRQIDLVTSGSRVKGFFPKDLKFVVIRRTFVQRFIALYVHCHPSYEMETPNYIRHGTTTKNHRPHAMTPHAPCRPPEDKRPLAHSLAPPTHIRCTESTADVVGIRWIPDMPGALVSGPRHSPSTLLWGCFGHPRRLPGGANRGRLCRP